MDIIEKSLIGAEDLLPPDVVPTDQVRGGVTVPVTPVGTKHIAHAPGQTLEAKLIGLDSTNATTVQRLDSLRADLTTTANQLAADVLALTNKNAQQDARVDGVVQSVSNLDTALRALIATAEANTAQVQTNLDTFVASQAVIDAALQADIATINTEIANLNTLISTTNTNLTAQIAQTEANLITQINAAEARSIPLTQKGAANGVPTLGASGIIPLTQLPPSTGIPLTQKNAANGVAPLDASGRVPRANLPSVNKATSFYLMGSNLTGQLKPFATATRNNIKITAAGTVTFLKAGTYLVTGTFGVTHSSVVTATRAAVFATQTVGGLVNMPSLWVTPPKSATVGTKYLSTSDTVIVTVSAGAISYYTVASFANPSNLTFNVGCTLHFAELL